MSKREALAKVPLFAKLEPKYLDRLADLSVPKTFPRDTLLIKEGGTGLGMFVIISGRVEVYKGEGDKRTILSVLDSGTIVGEMALVDDLERSASVRALETTECLLITRDSFNTLIRQEPGVAMAIMAVLAERIRTSQSKIQHLEKTVSKAVTEAKEPLQDWTSTTQERQSERDADESTWAGTSRLRDGQRELLRAGTDWMDGVMGMMGAFMGGVARMMDAANDTAGDGTRRFTRTFSRAVDEGVRAFEDTRTRRGREESEGTRTSSN